MNPSVRHHEEPPLTPSVEHARVADAMHPGIVSCPADATATKVARLMALHHVHCIFVMHRDFDGSGEPYVWGIISDLDLMEAVLRGDAATPAESLAHQPMVSVDPGMRLREACSLMVKHGVGHLVVVDDARRPIGVLSTTDVADVFAWGEA